MKNYHNLLFIFTLIFSIGCEDDKDDADDSAEQDHLQKEFQHLAKKLEIQKKKLLFPF